MKYNLAVDAEAHAASEYLINLIDKNKLAEVKAISPKRSLNQNSYLHLLLTAFGTHFGYTVEEAKTIYKRDFNPGIYVYEKNDAKFLRSSADLSVDEMTKSIDRFRSKSDELGCPLPTATDQGWLRSIENEAERLYSHL